MTEFDIRPARDDDLPKILETLRASLGETALLRRTPELWAWKHTQNPFGKSIVFVAESNGMIAGVRAMMRWRLATRDGRSLSCLRPVDTATHPDFARMGVFRELTMTVLDVARAEGVDLVFNTPNKQSRPGYLGMGWRDVATLGLLFRPRLGSALVPATGEIPSISTVAPRAIRVFDPSMGDVDRPPLGLRTPRTGQYLRWRFNSHPTAPYGWIPSDDGGGLMARVGVRRGRTELVISDLLGSPTAHVIRDVASRSRARYLAAWFSPGSPERKTALRGGMIPVPWPKTLNLVALPLSDLRLDVFDLRSWDLSTSDLELL